MIKTAGPEITNITDPETGSKIAVSTSARIIFRKMHPDWAKVKNTFLNNEIAKEFAKAKVIQFFTSKKNKDETGDIRGTETSKFICLHRSNYVFVIAAKGSHSLPPPPKQTVVKSSKQSQSNVRSAEGRDDSLRAHRGWLENHYFDIFIGQAALDSKSEQLLKEYIKNNGGIRKFKKKSVKEVQQMAHDQASQMAFTMLREDQRGQLTRDPGLLGPLPGNLSVPFSFPLE